MFKFKKRNINCVKPSVKKYNDNYDDYQINIHRIDIIYGVSYYNNDNKCYRFTTKKEELFDITRSYININRDINWFSCKINRQPCDFNDVINNNNNNKIYIIDYFNGTTYIDGDKKTKDVYYTIHLCENIKGLFDTLSQIYEKTERKPEVYISEITEEKIDFNDVVKTKFNT